MHTLRSAFLIFVAAIVARPVVASRLTPSDRVVRNVIVRAAPTTRSLPLDALGPGDTAEIVGDAPGWFHVRLPDGREGFVSKLWTVRVAEIATSGGYKLHMIDVGTGLAVFVEGPGFSLLYDGGSQDDLAFGGANRIVAYLKAARPDLSAIDHLILSHPHKDHLELLPDVFDRYLVRNVWDAGSLNPTNGYCKFLKKVAAETGVRYHDAVADGGVREVEFNGSSCSGPVRISRSNMMTAQAIPLGAGGRMSILYRDASRHSDANENTVVVRLDLGASRVLLAGDAEAGDRQDPATAPAARSIEGRLLACCRGDLKADVLVVGHHGSLTSSRTLFLDAVGASMFLVSSGPHPYSGVRLPDAAVIAELSRRGRVWRSDNDDEKCGHSAAKVGPDADESPGGCDNVVVEFDGVGGIAASYDRRPD